MTGVELYLFDGSDSRIIPNNSAILSNNFGQLPKFQCVSGSKLAGVGQWFTPSGQSMNLNTNDAFDIIVGDDSDPGYVDMWLHPGRILTAQDQGIYTCQIPDEAGRVSTLYVGIYLPALKGLLLMLFDCTSQSYLVYIVPITISSLHESPSTVFSLNCSSLGSPPTTVVWMKDDEVLTANETYTTAQYLRDGVASEYDSILMIRSPMSEIMGTYTCLVENSLGLPSKETLTLEGQPRD